MIPASFEYHAPTTVAEAVKLLQEGGDGVKLLAGGHSLLPAMKLRLASFDALIDITKIEELKGISANGGLTIGAGTTYSTIVSSDAVRKHCPVLAECIGVLGDIQVRNRGTIGGSIAHADPAADLPALVLALNATLTAQGPGGERMIAADDMFVGMLATALAPDEILTKVTFPLLGSGEGAAYHKMRQPASRYAIVGVAAYVKLEGGKVSAARVAMTGAGAVAVRQPEVEQALIGSDGSDEAIAAAAEQAGNDIDYLGDIHASEEYRRAMVKVYTRRALSEAVQRARG
jgi:carbon-monoxide dehydrogenase medium subunit